MSPCEAGKVACVNDSLANCTQGVFALTKCPDGQVYVLLFRLCDSLAVMLTIAQVSSISQDSL